MTRLRRVLILSSTGGYGHSAAANTLIHLLQKEWTYSIFYPIKELRIFGLSSGESLYNFLLSQNLTQITNWMATAIAPYLFKTRIDKTIRLIENQLTKEKPDLLISLVPFVNYPASEAARRFGIPFLIITTDNDLTNWVYDLEKLIHPRVKITIGYDLPSTRGLLQKRAVRSEIIESIGLPLRPAFRSPIDKEQLRLQQGISSERFVVLIMMGGIGGKVAYEYAKRLMALPMNLHLIVCTGQNRSLATHLATLPITGDNYLEIVPFTEHVHTLMALCDLLITKPGPGTLNEAIALRLPILVDYMSTPLFWEKVNIELVQARGIGKAIHTMDGLEPTILQMLEPTTQQQIKEAYNLLPPNHFYEKLPSIVEELCPRSDLTYIEAHS